MARRRTWAGVVAILIGLLAVPLPSSVAAHDTSRSEGEVDVEGDDEEIDTTDPDAAGFDAVFDTPLDELLVLPGDCPTAAPIEPGNTIDCFFDLQSDVVLDEATIERLGFVNAFVANEYAACSLDVDARRVACLALTTNDFMDGAFSIALESWGSRIDEAATATWTWGDGTASIFSQSFDGSVVFDERPFFFDAYVVGEVDRLFMVVRERNGTEVVEQAELPLPGPDGVQGSVDLAALPLGTYRFWPCVGPTASQCVEQPGGAEFQVIDGEPLELIAGHNRPSAERINVIFFGSGLDRMSDGDPELQLPLLAERMLTLDGPLGIDIDDNVLAPDELAFDLVWGPMAIEPLASNAHRFNFWYLADDVFDEESLLFQGDDPRGDVGFDLPNVHLSALHYDPARPMSDARVTSFETTDPSDVPVAPRLAFGDDRTSVDRFFNVRAATTLAHEWGHSLFGLRDEYYGFDDRLILVGYPNCAPDVATAEAWWGPLIGQVDPFAAEVQEISDARLLPASRFDRELEARTAIEITDGGCYGDVDEPGVVRPSEDSLMNGEVPVFGAVNRQRVEEVLDRFSGRGPMLSLDDLELECERIEWSVTCEGELLSYLDKPLSTVAIDGEACEFGTSRTERPVAVTCSFDAPRDDAAPFTVRLSFKTDSERVRVVDATPEPDPPAAPPEPDPDEVAAEDVDPPEGGGSGRTVAIGGLLIVAAVALAFVERRRRATAEDDATEAQ